MAAVAPNGIANAVADGLLEIRAKGVLPPGLEWVDLREGAHQGLLDEVAGVGAQPGPPWEPAPGPTLQGGQKTGEEGLQRVPVTRPKPDQQVLRGRAGRPLRPRPCEPLEASHCPGTSPC